MALPTYKDIIELMKKGSTIEAQEKIIELRQSALDIQEENLQLKDKIKELEEKLSLKEQVIWIKPSYWIQDGVNKDGPFCQTCYDNHKKLIRLQSFQRKGKWHCDTCDSTVYDESYSPPSMPSMARF